MLRFLLLGILLLPYFQQSSTVNLIEKEAFSVLMKKGLPIVDIRTSEEFDTGHIKEALNVDFLSETFVNEISKLDKEKPLLIYCRSGNRSGKATKLMDSLGFQKMYDLKGGYLNWMGVSEKDTIVD